MTLLGNFVRTREQGEQRMYWRSMNGMRSSSRTHSFLMKTLILASHASSAPFVPFERILFFLSGHLYKISQQSHLSRTSPIMEMNKINEGSDCRGAIHCALVPGRFTGSRAQFIAPLQTPKQFVHHHNSCIEADVQCVSLKTL